MRHFYFRLTMGIVFAGCLIFSAVTMNLPGVLLFLFMSTTFLYSAYTLWKKGDGPQ